MGYIYCITNLVNQKKYVGKTIYSITERFKEHCSDSKRERCEKRPLYDAMNKYGIENFDSITQAAHWLADNKYAKSYSSGIKSHISYCIRGKVKTAYKFIWK